MDVQEHCGDRQGDEEEEGEDTCLLHCDEDSVLEGGEESLLHRDCSQSSLSVTASFRSGGGGIIGGEDSEQCPTPAACLPDGVGGRRSESTMSRSRSAFLARTRSVRICQSKNSV